MTSVSGLLMKAPEKDLQWHGKNREDNGFENRRKTAILVITWEICYRFTCYFFYGFWLWQRKICVYGDIVWAGKIPQREAIKNSSEDWSCMWTEWWRLSEYRCFIPETLTDSSSKLREQQLRYGTPFQASSTLQVVTHPIFHHFTNHHASANLPSHYKPSCLIQASITLQIIMPHPIFHRITNHHASSNLPSHYKSSCLTQSSITLQIIMPHTIFHHIKKIIMPHTIFHHIKKIIMPHPIFHHITNHHA
jgi:hypothetical protein